jgi:hypothetical protein
MKDKILFDKTRKVVIKIADLYTARFNSPFECLCKFNKENEDMNEFYLVDVVKKEEYLLFNQMFIKEKTKQDGFHEAKKMLVNLALGRLENVKESDKSGDESKNKIT